MRLWPRRRSAESNGRERSALSIDEYIRQQSDWFSFNGNTYPLGFNQTLPGKPQEPIPNDFTGYVRGAYKSNSIVFACILARMSLFAEARFQFRRLRSGKPQGLFGNPDLVKLERPWRNGTTGDLLARMEQDYSLGGNAYILDRGAAGLRRLRPDWVTIVIGSDLEDPLAATWDPNSEILGYAYTIGGPASGRAPELYRPELIAHYSGVTPDPEASFRGMSWLTPAVIEIMGDKAASEHKLDFFERGGTPNLTVEYDPEYVKDGPAFQQWMDAIEDQIAKFGPTNRRLHLGGGTKANVIGNSFDEIQFSTTQGAGEIRIASASGVPPIVLGLLESLQGSSLNAGNFESSMRRFADVTMRPLWRSVCGSLAPLVAVPGGAELWYDDRDISALQANRTDAAAIQDKEATTINTLVTAGFEPDSVTKAVLNNDWNLLVHSGLPSVQVQPAGSNGSGSPTDAQQAVDQAAQ